MWTLRSCSWTRQAAPSPLLAARALAASPPADRCAHCTQVAALGLLPSPLCTPAYNAGRCMRQEERTRERLAMGMPVDATRSMQTWLPACASLLPPERADQQLPPLLPRACPSQLPTRLVMAGQLSLCELMLSSVSWPRGATAAFCLPVPATHDGESLCGTAQQASGGCPRG